MHKDHDQSEPENSLPNSSEEQASPSVESDDAPTSDKAAEQTINLDQFLKKCGVETGGQAKRLIQGGEVLVNNEIETRRRRKLRSGDEVTLFDDTFVVNWETDTSDFDS